jgi:hypothetical protein
MFSSANSLRKTSICIAFLLLLIGFASSFSFAAGSISGTVTAATGGAGIPNATVTAYDSSWNFIASAVTDSSGIYSITGLTPGSYYLRSINSLGYIDKFYNSSSGSTNRGSASTVSVTDLIDTPGISFSLSSGAGSISGSVVRQSNGVGIQDVTITAYLIVDNGYFYIAWVKTDPSGNYSIPGLAPGSLYYLKTSNSFGYVNEYYDNAEISGTAVAVTVTASTNTPDKNFSLDLGGSISGRVTNPEGVGLANIRIDAFRPINFFNTTYSFTDSSGYYTITGLAAGYHYVGTNQNNNDNYNDHFYPNNQDPIAVPVALATDTPNINLSLALGGSILGRVTRDSDGTGIQSANVVVYDNEGVYRGGGQTDSLGYYAARGVPPGHYYLQAAASNYVNEYYSNAGFHKTATVVSVAQEVDTPNINFSLAAAAAQASGSISGRVTRESDSAGLSWPLQVRAYGSSSLSSYSSTTPDGSGNYSITGLTPGTYYVTTYSSSSYVDKYYNNATSRNVATPVTVISSTTTPDINFSLASGAGAISGRVTRASDGVGIYNVQIYVYDTSWIFIKTVSTDGSGNYAIRGLAPGSYYVATNRATAYIDEYYSNVTSQGAATAVTVNSSATTSGIDFSLSLGWTISGNVSSKSDGAAIAGVHVNVYNSSWGLIASTDTDSSGAYYMEGFASGDYYLQASDSPGYIGEYYNNVKSPDTATPIHIYNDTIYSGAGFAFLLAPVAPEPADFDADVKADITVWRPDTGYWYTLPSSAGGYTSTPWGLASDVPVLGDYDGDGKADVAVWRSSNGVWYTLPSSALGTYTSTSWGLPGDVPVVGDYDGDGKSDIAVWRSSDGVWYILTSNTPGNYKSIAWGLAGDIPIPNDYDGDGKTDIAVWRASTGVWYVLPSESPGTYIATSWGLTSDKPVPSDYDRDGKADIAVWRPSDGVWYVLPSRSPGTYTSTAWGLTSDIPAPGDYDGDGKADIAVWRPSNGVWYILLSGSPGSYLSIAWGLSDDQPVTTATGILKLLP